MMKHKKDSANRKALPKFFGIILLSALMGAGAGIVIGVSSATGLSDRILEMIRHFLRLFTPWSILVLSVPMLGGSLALYLSARKQAASWDGEEERLIDKVEEKLCWALLIISLNMILDFFFFGIGTQVGDKSMRLLLVSFLLSNACIIVLQQKVVDLTRQLNPEKQGSVYDTKFQKKWLESCDENELRQIGQASYKAFHAVNNTCILLWMLLILLAVAFQIGVLPFFLVTLIFAVNQAVYGLECIRMTRHRS